MEERGTQIGIVKSDDFQEDDAKFFLMRNAVSVRSCELRLAEIELTASVRNFQLPE
jgi:hypothetical protein